ncbi:methyl-accepting chemotaxis protein [Pseudomonas cichorii]|uniref:methyl-accepting chemotaxis protein n=1 Tax=Pseudomonas cichorii TaxID=36746 RepID=UPI001C89E96A|nr:methyl-accepting chemotaxis protein [Pseudomonas cichorii]MBX8483637.1 methyl-accepting chemotaxis protein [Pseudomonas cichorii]MBX8493597.1 methyl-accepting chemotaxis protein [Pseudomonas cichorii]MBX8532107.1 methyl-accepting chemotaxis protein [Pseudomonas cichorii]MBX8577483.1 methyl-accepting chemotaxis protein [Pseudomonas cichorii]
MVNWFAGMLGNISVRSKLILGFISVLLLTTLIAAFSWVEIGILRDRGQKLTSISQLNEMVRDMRIARLTYAVQPSADRATAVLKANDNLETHYEEVRALLSHPQDLALIYRAMETTQRYRSHFQDFVRATEIQDESKLRQAQSGLDTEVASLFDAGGQLLISQTSKRDEDIAEARVLLIAATAFALILGTLAAWLITRSIVGPLMETLRAAERVAAGDLSADIPVNRKDELGLLQASMQRMTVNLRDLIGGIRDGVVQLASASEQLSAVTEQTTAGVSSQKSETDQVAVAMNQMAATVQEVARNAEDASHAAIAAHDEARKSDEVVLQAIDQIGRLAEEVNHSTDAMNDLSRESDKIGTVLDVIKSVAQQTNLLALNAAIEAARAGAAGRGFAVVADEVRSLAQRTQASTEEIEGLVSSLQNGTQKVAAFLGNSLSLSKSSVELTRRAGTSLMSISRSVSTVEQMNTQIAAAAEQQSIVADEINRRVVNVRVISEQTYVASGETAMSSTELARLGGSLQASVGRFRF